MSAETEKGCFGSVDDTIGYNVNLAMYANQLERDIMSEHTFIINGELPSLNEYTGANRGNKYKGNTIKRNGTNRCFIAANNALRNWKRKPNKTGLYDLEISWLVRNNRKDSDNVFFAVKFILDGMVKAGMIEDDNRKHIRNISHTIQTSREEQYIKITLKGVVSNG